MEPKSEPKLIGLNPRLVEAIRVLDTLFRARFPGDFLRVAQGLRTWEEQAAIYAQGRDANGKVINKRMVVSNAPPGHSQHNFGLAVDLIPFTLLQQPGWASTSPLWEELGEMGEGLKLTWGGRWRTPDLPHFQIQGKWPVSPNDAQRQTFVAGGFDKVWKDGQLS